MIILFDNIISAFTRRQYRSDAINFIEFNRNLRLLKNMISDADVQLKKEKVNYSASKLPNGYYPISYHNDIICDIKNFEKKPFWSRWWARLSGKAKAIDNKRLWLAADICKPFLNSKVMGDTNFKIKDELMNLFPKKWRNTLGEILFCIKNDDRHKRLKAEKENIRSRLYQVEAIDDNDNVQTCETSSHVVIHSHLMQIQTVNKEIEDQMSSFVVACGFFNLPYDTTTSRQVNKELKKLFVRLHPDKKVNGFTNKAGEWITYSDEVSNNLSASMGRIFDFFKDFFKNLPPSSDKVLRPYDVLNQYTIEGYKMGIKLRQHFDANIDTLLKDLPATSTILENCKKQNAILKKENAMLKSSILGTMYSKRKNEHAQFNQIVTNAPVEQNNTTTRPDQTASARLDENIRENNPPPIEEQQCNLYK